MKVAEKDVLVHCHHVTCSYGDSVVVSDVNFTLRRGEFAGIVGPSGSGKTSLLRALTGTVRAARGSVELANGIRLGYVPQVESVDWNFPITVREVLAMTRTKRRWPVVWCVLAKRRHCMMRLWRNACARRAQWFWVKPI
jgi:ABC-type Mn2+/Zn2+ transport system ATPase subunit